MFANMVRSCLRRGLLMGYRVTDESLHVIRGRIRTADHLRRRFALPLPAEVRYDDYTEDIEENRLVKAAIRRLIAFRPESSGLRRRLAEIQAAMTLVADVRYSSSALPRFTYTRLNEHYRTVLELSALIVRNLVVEFHPGARRVSALLFDMNKVFEDFIFESLRQRLPATVSPGDQWHQGPRLQLDHEAVLRPEPDLSWWRGGRCIFVGDAKYKVAAEGHLADLYQLLAYCTASGLQEGLLVYAEQPAGPTRHQIVRDGPVLSVEAVNVEAQIAAIEQRCDELASLVKQSAARAVGPRSQWTRAA
jgi:5-methylcytosine-specific restriction enzyme subunit McrC